MLILLFLSNQKKFLIVDVFSQTWLMMRNWKSWNFFFSSMGVFDYEKNILLNFNIQGRINYIIALWE